MLLPELGHLAAVLRFPRKALASTMERKQKQQKNAGTPAKNKRQSPLRSTRKQSFGGDVKRARPVQPKTTTSKRSNIDILTGRESVSVYFDPSALLEGENAPLSDADWVGEHTFMPAALVKEDHAKGIFTVKVPAGDVYRLNKVLCGF